MTLAMPRVRIVRQVRQGLLLCSFVRGPLLEWANTEFHLTEAERECKTPQTNPKPN